MTWPTEAERHVRLHKRAGSTEEAMPIDRDEVNLVVRLRSGLHCKCGEALRKEAAVEIERLQEVVERLTFFQIQNKKLREALEAIADGHTPYRMDKEKYFRDAALQFRDTARVALGRSPSEKGESDD
jgi:hypothetical protein